MKRLFLLLLALVPAFASAQKQWTLDECIAHALEHNITIKQQQLAAQSKSLSLAESKWGYAPDVSLSSGYNLSTGRVLDPTTYDFVENQSVTGASSSVSGSTVVFGGMRKMHLLKRAQLDLRASLQGVEKARNDVTLNVTALYLETLGAQESIRDAGQIVAALTVQAEKTARLVEARKVTAADLLQVQSQLAEAENGLFAARNAYDIARLDLCQLLEIEDYASFETIPPSDEQIDAGMLPSDAATATDAAQWLPQLEMARLGIDIARRDLRLAQTGYYPTLSLAAGYGTSYSDARRKALQNPDGTYRYETYRFFDQYRDNANSYISLSLNIPLFGRFTTRKNVRRQRIALMQAEYALRTAEKQVTREVNQAYIDAATARERFNSSLKYVATATEAARQIERKYNLGVATVVDYNASVSALVKAQTQFLQAKYEYIFKTKVIEFYTK